MEPTWFGPSLPLESRYHYYMENSINKTKQFLTEEEVGQISFIDNVFFNTVKTLDFSLHRLYSFWRHPRNDDPEFVKAQSVFLTTVLGVPQNVIDTTAIKGILSGFSIFFNMDRNVFEYIRDEPTEVEVYSQLTFSFYGKLNGRESKFSTSLPANITLVQAYAIIIPWLESFKSTDTVFYDSFDDCLFNLKMKNLSLLK